MAISTVKSLTRINKALIQATIYYDNYWPFVSVLLKGEAGLSDSTGLNGPVSISGSSISNAIVKYGTGSINCTPRGAVKNTQYEFTKFKHGFYHRNVGL